MRLIDWLIDYTDVNLGLYLANFVISNSWIIFILSCRFLAQELGKDFGHFAESVLPSLISMIPNSAKIIATSVTVAVQFIIQVWWRIDGICLRIDVFRRAAGH